MNKLLKYVITVLLALFLLSLQNLLYSQPMDYKKAMNDIMENYLPDYPAPAIKAFEQLFSDVDVDELPAEVSFLYHYYYGSILAENHPDTAIAYLTKARIIASSNRKIGIRCVEALNAEKYLADLYRAKHSDESVAAAMCLYSDIITVGISLLKDSDVCGLVILSMIELAKLGVEFWKDPDWVEKIWIQVRDLALEINDGSYYSFYVLSVLKYYCDLGNYDTALSFMEDAKNKDMLQVDASSFCQYIRDIKVLLSQSEAFKMSDDIHSLDYWRNKLDIAILSTVLCTKSKSISLLQEVEQGLISDNLTESYEYAKVLYVLSNNTSEWPELAEGYFIKQINILDSMPKFFVYTTDVEVFNTLGVCQMKQGRYAEAQVNYCKALQCLERDSEFKDSQGYKEVMAIIYHNLGRNLFFLGEYKKSQEHFTASISIQKETGGEVLPKTQIYLSETMEHIKEN